MISYLSVMRELHVLFVDHEWNSLTTTDLIEACHYRVTPVLLATAAISMISNGNTKIDFIIANINSPDVLKLLQLAVSMEIPTILMSNDDDITSMGAWAIEKGAFLYIKRPTNPDMLRYLWQHVARETMRVARECERLLAASNITPPCGVGFGDMENPNNSFAMDNGKSKMNYYYNEKYVKNEYIFDNMMSQGKVKRKMCTEWTEELHKKFVDAAEQLGRGNIYPKEILEKTNVPGLTRTQVASHLQKWRNEEYRLRKDRKSTLRFNPKSSDGEGSSYKPRRFGSMPRLSKEKSKDRVYDHGSISEMEAKVSETGMTNQSSDKPRRFGSLPEIMKADSKEQVDDHGSRSEMEAMASETDTYNQYLEYEALFSFPPLESVAHSPHASLSK